MRGYGDSGGKRDRSERTAAGERIGINGLHLIRDLNGRQGLAVRKRKSADLLKALGQRDLNKIAAGSKRRKASPSDTL